MKATKTVTDFYNKSKLVLSEDYMIYNGLKIYYYQIREIEHRKNKNIIINLVVKIFPFLNSFNISSLFFTAWPYDPNDKNYIIKKEIKLNINKHLAQESFKYLNEKRLQIPNRKKFMMFPEKFKFLEAFNMDIIDGVTCEMKKLESPKVSFSKFEFDKVFGEIFSSNYNDSFNLFTEIIINAMHTWCKFEGYKYHRNIKLTGDFVFDNDNFDLLTELLDFLYEIYYQDSDKRVISFTEDEKEAFFDYKHIEFRHFESDDLPDIWVSTKDNIVILEIKNLKYVII